MYPTILTFQMLTCANPMAMIHKSKRKAIECPAVNTQQKELYNTNEGDDLI